MTSPSFQSEKAEEGWSTADFRARSARPSEERESAGMKLNKTWNMRSRKSKRNRECGMFVLKRMVMGTTPFWKRNVRTEDDGVWCCCERDECVKWLCYVLCWLFMREWERWVGAFMRRRVCF